MTQIDPILSEKKVLLTPLNWGLGHATRCVPVIDALQQSGANVTLAADGLALAFLKKTYPNLPVLVLEDIHMTYAAHHHPWVQTLLNYPQLRRQVKNEHHELKKIVDQHGFDLIISDNRYGCFHHTVTSVIITHQLYPKSPIFQKLARRKIAALLRNFDRVWIPDFEHQKESLSGALSHPGNELTTYLGPLSQVENHEMPPPEKDLAVLLSGPEPNRTQLEQTLLQFLSDKKVSGYFIRGTESPFNHSSPEQMEVIDLAYGADLSMKLSACKKVIARGGYSTIMDLYCLNKPGMLIPTTGQPEQEYLAKWNNSNQLFCFASEQDAHLHAILEDFLSDSMPQTDIKKRSASQQLLLNACKELSI